MRELYSIEAEHSVLGALMLDESLFDQITNKLTAADFYDMENAALFNAIIETREAGEPIDPVTVGVRHPLLPSGQPMLRFAGQIAANVPSAANWDAYAKHVKERAVLRAVVSAADVIRESATEDRPLADIIASAQQSMADLRDLDDSAPDYKRLSQVLPGVINEMDAKLAGETAAMMTTGLPELDKLLGGGLRKKGMYVIGGRPGSGKTTLGLQIAQDHCVHRKGVGMVFSLEMPEEELCKRTLASLGSVSLNRMDTPVRMQEADWVGLTSAANLINGAELYLCDRPGLTISRIRSIARQVQRNHGLEVMVLDYIGLIKAEGKHNGRHEGIAAISTAIKNMTKELGIPIIVLAQLNRESTKRGDKRPQASDLRDSGQIEQDADAVLLVHRDDDTEEGQNGVTELILDKGRQAPVGSCLVQQQGQYARFVPFAGTRDSYAEHRGFDGEDF